jgi:hypothetical protein
MQANVAIATSTSQLLVLYCSTQYLVYFLLLHDPKLRIIGRFISPLRTELSLESCIRLCCRLVGLVILRERLLWPRRQPCVVLVSLRQRLISAGMLAVPIVVLLAVVLISQ